MAHRLAPGAEVELDEIWLWTAKESGSVDIADRLIDCITERFFLLARYPPMARPPPPRVPAALLGDIRELIEAARQRRDGG
jgi:plasmid stabilization system protein ParE